MNLDVYEELPKVAELLALCADDLDQAEEIMLAWPQAETPVTNHFGPGVYIREAFLPAGALIIGHHHNDETLNVMLSGRVALLVAGEVSIIEAPYMLVSPAGRKAAYVLEDTVWQNVYATTERDIAKLEATYVTPSEAWVRARGGVQ